MNYLKTFKDLVKTYLSRNLSNNPIYPSTLMYVFTNKCNSKCIMCNIWKNKSKIPELTLEDIKMFVKSKYLKDIVALNLTGGEPFLRGDIVEICKVFINNLKHLKEIRFATNAMLTKKIESDIKELLKFKNIIIDVTISLDGIKETHDKIRGIKGNYDLAIRTIKSLKKLQISHKNLELGVRFTIQPQNYIDLMKVFYLCRKYNLNFISKMVMTDDNFLQINSKEFKPFFTKEQKQQIINDIKKIIKFELKSIKNKQFYLQAKDYLRIIFMKYLIKHIKNPKKMLFHCYALFSSATLGYEGSVYNCNPLMGKLGSIKEESFDRIWTSKKARIAREKIKRCNSICYSTCYQTPSILFKKFPEIFLSILRNKII